MTSCRLCGAGHHCPPSATHKKVLTWEGGWSNGWSIPSPQMQTTPFLTLEVLAKGTELLVPAACGPFLALFRWLTGRAGVNTRKEVEGCMSAHTDAEKLFTRIFGRLAEHSRLTMSEGLKVKVLETGQGSPHSRRSMCYQPTLTCPWLVFKNPFWTSLTKVSFDVLYSLWCRSARFYHKAARHAHRPYQVRTMAHLLKSEAAEIHQTKPTKFQLRLWAEPHVVNIKPVCVCTCWDKVLLCSPGRPWIQIKSLAPFRHFSCFCYPKALILESCRTAM